ncbi:hypothetical protein RF55_10141 [Lasius niger]|uniref:Uncharacterized protein n=1 Tax=Lasius niger TaxID=67767 RepID=A0A0J7KIV7_LASNI|nr:hypothetical protein RF55_10141 [Lasius niger]
MTGTPPRPGPVYSPGVLPYVFAGGIPHLGQTPSPLLICMEFTPHAGFQGSRASDLAGTAAGGATRGAPRTIGTVSPLPGTALSVVATSHPPLGAHSQQKGTPSSDWQLRKGKRSLPARGLLSSPDPAPEKSERPRRRPARFPPGKPLGDRYATSSGQSPLESLLAIPAVDPNHPEPPGGSGTAQADSPDTSGCPHICGHIPCRPVLPLCAHTDKTTSHHRLHRDREPSIVRRRIPPCQTASDEAEDPATPPRSQTRGRPAPTSPRETPVIPGYPARVTRKSRNTPLPPKQEGLPEG